MLSIAAAQCRSRPGDVEANIREHSRFARAAASAGADIVTFPELSLTGYEPDLGDTLAFSSKDERLAPMQALSTSLAITIVCGAPIRLDSRLHIGAFILRPDSPTLIYTKRHVYGDENDVFVPGDLDPIIRVKNQPAALAICADTTFPAHAESAANRDARLYLAGVFFGPERISANTERLAGYAATLGMCVLMANSAGPSSRHKSGGGSAIWSDSGECIIAVDGLGTALVVARKNSDGWTGEVIRDLPPS